MTRRWPARLAWLVAGLGWLVWLGLEDRSTNGPLLVALALVVAGTLTLLRRWKDPLRAMRWPHSLGLGLLAGASVPALAVVLMFVKVSLHSHPVADFNLDQIRWVLARAPVWAAIGLLMSAARLLIAGPRERPFIDGVSRVEYNEANVRAEK
jgi:hypothetical protein